MKPTAIRAEGLGKEYHIGVEQESHTLSERVTRALRAPFRRAGKLLRGQATGAAELDDTIWALRDVSFQVDEGEVVGIIGRNGAGKSTLLKILSRITEPSEGYVDVYGTVGSLLEVGTGFHPELTGRENVFLNGAILGMKRGEIERKFDEIVSFAGIRKFMDTPVKHYSSGMYVRLAFAVAAHLEPQILLVDEVLSVGDAEFQQKCLGKMSDVAGSGRTVLFISHNMAAVNRLCERALWLHDGRIRMDGAPRKVISEYLASSSVTSGERVWEEGFARPDVEEFRLDAVYVENSAGERTGQIHADDPFTISIEYRILEPVRQMRLGVILSTADGIGVLDTYETDDERFIGPRPPGRYRSEVTIPGKLLGPSRYFVTVSAGIPNGKYFGAAESALGIDIQPTGAVGSAVDAPRHALLRPELDWEVRSVTQEASESRKARATL